MTRLRIAFALVATLAVGCFSAPLPEPDPNTPEIIEIIAPAGIAQETLDSLNLGEPNAEQSERTKRTIGILRQLFPTLSQIIDQKIQQIIGILIRTVGRNLLAGAIGGGGNSGTNSANSGDKISVSLPAFGPDDDDDDDSDEDTSDSTSSKKPDVINRFDDSSDEATPPSSTDNEATSAVNADENLLSGAESQQSEVRVQFDENDNQKAEETKDDQSDQESAASGGNNGAIDDLSLDDADANDENRNKRFLSFGGASADGHSSGGSGGGSGNFLFDIIRRPAESVARAAGQAFRILTGTDSIGLGITATHTAVRDITNNNATKLVAGSGGTEASDEATASPDDVHKGDGYTEGIPGPVTRLFIIANRGISNLIQDLILRIAQTSERIVNFKARLITSII